MWSKRFYPDGSPNSIHGWDFEAGENWHKRFYPKGKLKSLKCKYQQGQLHFDIDENYKEDGSLWTREISAYENRDDRLESLKVMHIRDGSYFTTRNWFGEDGKSIYSIAHYFKKGGVLHREVVNDRRIGRETTRKFDKQGNLLSETRKD